MAVGEQTGCDAAPIAALSAPQIHLLIQKGPQKGTRLVCRHVVTLVGSRAGCKVRLPHEQVAPVHAALFNDGKSITVVDLLSPGGTYLNELKVEQEKLTDGDRLEIGPWDFIVEITKPDRNGHNGNGNGELVDLDPTPRAVAIEHVDSGRLLQPNREVCLIGRRTGCDIVVDSPDVSRVHALLVTYKDYPAVVDLISKNGTRVNDQPVHFQSLKNSDLIEIGDSIFRVRIVGSSVAEKPVRPKPVKPVEDEVLELDGADEHEPDLISIESVESAQRWRIADDLDKVEKASRR